MTDLPTLKIECGEAYFNGMTLLGVCGKGGFLCEGCHTIIDRVLPIILAHAADYDRKWKEFPDELGLKYARDAVLALLPKELKEKAEVEK